MYFILVIVFHKEYFYSNFYTFPLYERLHVNKGKIWHRKIRKKRRRTKRESA